MSTQICDKDDEDMQQLQLGPLQFAFCSGISATFAVILTHPMDVVKTRYQVINKHEGVNIWSVLQQTVRSEGLQIFHKGLLARILTIAPQSALSWMIYESVKKIIQ
eukprot:TRINITY_DN6681_c0_g1_i2.p3 TRINITY_DN6681_c0_g1~~TRINITY_DN6681_c0_g1_i2.p3  ORF type:complete len:117 (+),score=7.16 TRINITY_DN6681_c0_g1_i2:36-353(+)